MTSSTGANNLLEQLTELRETLTFTSLLKDMIKDTDEEPGEEKHGARSGRVLSTGASVPMELRCIIPHHVDCSATQKLSKPHTLGILWRLHHVAVMDH